MSAAAENVAAAAVVAAILRDRPTESSGDWKYVAEIAVAAIKALPLDVRMEAMGMRWVSHRLWTDEREWM